jgi:UDP-N-acetylmuramyl-tripeptide synthetase
VKFRELLARADLHPLAVEGDPEVRSLASDSRRTRPGTLFVCMPGANQDSQSFLPEAAKAGATAAIVRDAPGLAAARALGMAAAIVPDAGLAFHDAAWRLADAFFDHPTRRMKVIGVTGTNGKTTTASVLRDMLSALGFRAAYLGTLGFELPGERRDLPNTTPFAIELYNLLGEARDKGVDALAIEVSSHALAQRRIDGVEFDAAVFTNLTQDHLDFHGTMVEYEAAKRRLFEELPRQTSKRFVAALNQDDPVGRVWTAGLPDPKVRFSVRRPFDVWASHISVFLDRIEMNLRFAGTPATRVYLPLGGSYNVENLIAAYAGMRALDFSAADIITASASIRPVRGRFEPVKNKLGIYVLIDYAHTPDALRKLLATVRALATGRVITVFGCGGDRDRAKRPLMAREASMGSDLTIVTSDNPRTEDPNQIITETVAGIAPGRECRAIVDRAEAIREAVRIAQTGDTVVIAGKGHENYQIIGREKIHMDDRELAQAALSKRI